MALTIDEVMQKHEGCDWERIENQKIEIDGEMTEDVSPTNPARAPKELWFSSEGQGTPYTVKVYNESAQLHDERKIKPSKAFLTGSKNQDSQWEYYEDCKCYKATWTRSKL